MQDFILSLLERLLTLEAAAAVMIIAYHGKPLANFILRLCGKKVINGHDEKIGRVEFQEHERQDNDNMRQIFERIGKLEERTGKVETKVDGLKETLTRIENKLLGSKNNG